MTARRRRVAAGTVRRRVLTVNPVSTTNGTDLTLDGRTYRTQAPDTTYGLAVDADPAPTYSRHELRAGERWANDIANFPGDSRQRSELRSFEFLPYSTDIWVAWSVRITTTFFKNSVDAYNIITQYFQEPGSPILNFSIEQGVLGINTRGTEIHPSPVPDNVARFSVDFVPYIGQWVHFVMRVKFHYSAGELEVWMNGSPMGSPQIGIPIGYNDPNGPYEKHGIYREGHTETVVVEHANYTRGTSSLSARISSPLAVPA